MSSTNVIFKVFVLATLAIVVIAFVSMHEIKETDYNSSALFQNMRDNIEKERMIKMNMLNQEKPQKVLYRLHLIISVLQRLTLNKSLFFL